MLQNRFGGNDLHSASDNFGVGGGFVPSPAQGAGPASQGAKKFSSGKTTSRTVTIKQIAEACQATNDDTLTIDGEEVHNVVLVARVISKNQCSTYIDIKVDDGTGQIDAKFYIQEEEQLADMKAAECTEGRYVRVHGHVRAMEQEWIIIAFSLSPVVDYNEVTYHNLSCIHQHLYFTQAAVKAEGGATPMQAGGISRTNANDAGVKGMHKDPVLDHIQRILDTASRDMSAEEVAQAAEGRYSVPQVKTALARIADEGTAYSTTNDKFRTCLT